MKPFTMLNVALGGKIHRRKVFVFFSQTGRDPWRTLEQAEVPAWLRDDPAALGRVVETGEPASDGAGYYGVIAEREG